MPDDRPEASTTGGQPDEASLKQRLESYIGRILRHMGIYEVIERPYFLTHFVVYRILDILTGRYKGGLLSTRGFYRIDPPVESVEPYWYHLDVGQKHRRKRVDGSYEAAVMETLAEQFDPGCTFWEVGAYGGYYSLAFAERAGQVVAFDADDTALDRLRLAIDENGFENIVTVRENLGMDASLDDYLEISQPDVVLIDIEGWEYEVLKSADQLLQTKPVIVVELHAPGTGWSSNTESRPDTTLSADSVPPETVDPQGVISMLEEAGYTVTEVQRRRSSNWHVIAVP